MQNHIEHITITTGHTRPSPRSEVNNYAVDFCKSLLEKLKTANSADIIDGYVLRGNSESKSFIVSIYKQESNVPLITIAAVKEDTDAANKTWSAINNNPKLSMPSLPWGQLV